MNARLVYTTWSDNPEDAFTTAIGFLLHYDATNCTAQQVINEINAFITTETNTDRKNIPIWKPIMTTSSVIINGVTHRNLSYDITCRTQDSNKLWTLLEKAVCKPKFRDFQKFAPYSMKRSNPRLFANLVDKQFELCTDLLVIAVEIIPIQHMY